MRYPLTASVATLALLAGPGGGPVGAVAPHLAPPPAGAIVSMTKAVGSDCRKSTTISNDPSGQSAAATFADFTVVNSEDVGEYRKNCTLFVSISAPAGWSYTLKQAEFRGTVEVARRAEVHFSAARHEDGTDGRARAYSWSGSAKERWVAVPQFGASRALDCYRPGAIAIDSRAFAMQGNTRLKARLTVDSVRITVQDVAWTPC